MKKHYDVTLDEEKVEEIKAWLKPKNIAFSTYLNSLIDEQMLAIREFAPDGEMSKVTASRLFKLASKMVKNLNAERKK